MERLTLDEDWIEQEEIICEQLSMRRKYHLSEDKMAKEIVLNAKEILEKK